MATIGGLLYGFSKLPKSAADKNVSLSLTESNKLQAQLVHLLDTKKGQNP